MRRVIVASVVVVTFVAVVVCAGMVVVFAGPVRSGALFLLLPAGGQPGMPAVWTEHHPLHKGSVDLPTGLYTRENDDLVVPGAPALVLRRTYLSNYRASKQFGIGTTHPGEEYLIGDGERFQWMALILARGTRINFKRISAGTSISNALYVHDETPSEWYGARLGWTGMGWAIRKIDGTVLAFRSCGPKAGDSCSILWSRSPDGQTITYRRDGLGTLLRMESAVGRWIAFEYDGTGRIVLARASTAAEVRYEYDRRGRLTRVAASDGNERRYTYTDRDELATISEPGASIENIYRDGRCVRQINHFPDSEPFVFEFRYHVENGRIGRTETDRSDGTWTRYTWGPGGYMETETWGCEDVEPATFTYERDPVSQAVTALSLTCPDRTGRPLRHSSLVRSWNEEWIKMDLLRTHCSWSRWRRARSE